MYNDKTFFLEDTEGKFQLEGFALTAGDARISIDGGAFVNLTNLPVVRRADSIIFDLDLTEAEDVVGAEIRIEDQDTPPAFLPLSITISESTVPTAGENAQAIESRLANGGDGIDLAQIFADAFESALANEADGNMTSANVLQGAVTAALTAYDAATGQQVGGTLTLNQWLQNPTVMALIANAMAAASNGGTGTGTTGPSLIDIVDALEREDGQLAQTLKESTRYNFRQTARLGTSNPEMEFEPVTGTP